MPDSTLHYGVTFTNASNISKHSYDDYGFFMEEPVYSSKKRKDVLVSLPYMDGVLDFSTQHGNRAYFEAVEVTYKFFRKYPTVGNMRSGETIFKDYLWAFNGSIADDYGAHFTGVVCTGVTSKPHLNGAVLEIEATFRANTTST